MDLGSRPITRRSLPAIVAGIVIGALVITPGVGLAGKFLTKKKADKRYVNVGPEAAALKTRAVEASNDPADISLGGPFTDVLSASLTVPGPGQLIAQASAGMLGVTASSGGCRFRLGGTTMGQEPYGSTSSGVNMLIPLLARAPVGAGTHTVTIECGESGGDVRYAFGTMVLLFVPD